MYVQQDNRSRIKKYIVFDVAMAFIMLCLCAWTINHCSGMLEKVEEASEKSLMQEQQIRDLLNGEYPLRYKILELERENQQLRERIAELQTQN